MSAKGRLQPTFLDRTEAFADRCLAVAEELAQQRRFDRIVNQLAGAGTSVGANVAEADQAMSRRDFRKCLAIAIKELAETGYWLRLCVRRNWLPQARLDPLLLELAEIKLVLGSILTRTQPANKNDRTPI